MRCVYHVVLVPYEQLGKDHGSFPTDLSFVMIYCPYFIQAAHAPACLDYLNIIFPLQLWLLRIKCAADPEAAGTSEQFPKGLDASMANMVSTMKDEIIKHFHSYFAGPEDEASDPDNDQASQCLGVLEDIDAYANDDKMDTQANQPDSFSDLDADFCTAVQAGPPIDTKLAAIIDNLITAKLPQAKLTELLGKYSDQKTVQP